MPRYDLKNNKYIKYTGLATQLFVSLAIAAYFGKYLDRKLDLTKPLFTAIIPMILLILNFIWIYYDLKRQDS
jgi:membrane protein DedA with SNARE-associated domain